MGFFDDLRKDAAQFLRPIASYPVGSFIFEAATGAVSDLNIRQEDARHLADVNRALGPNAIPGEAEKIAAETKRMQAEVLRQAGAHPDNAMFGGESGKQVGSSLLVLGLLIFAGWGVVQLGKAYISKRG